MFYYYSYLPHRDLHSFPTRRSSDLLILAEILPSRSQIVSVVFHWPTGLMALVLASGSYFSVPGDRKSTRLNSSHRTISYAVFCLKKKNTTKTLARGRSLPVQTPLLV